MSLEDIKEDVGKLKDDMLIVCTDLKWIKRIGTVTVAAIVAIFTRVMFF